MHTGISRNLGLHGHSNPGEPLLRRVQLFPGGSRLNGDLSRLAAERGIQRIAARGLLEIQRDLHPNYPECANFPIITTGDFAGLGTNGPNGSDRLVFELHEDMTKIKGSHTFKWGYFYGNSHYDGFGLQNGSGSLGFSFTGTSLPLATSQATGGGSGFASFLLGAVNNYALDTPRYLTALYRTHQAYIQDDWRISRKLTLNLGFRYSMNIAPHVRRRQD